MKEMKEKMLDVKGKNSVDIIKNYKRFL